METMQVTLVQALAPETKAADVERSSEFSSILSGQEVASHAESPPGTQAPPGKQAAVEEAEIQEPNAQSQKPDFHCKNEPKTGNEEPQSDSDGCEESQPAVDDRSDSEGKAIAADPQLIAQSALAWVNLIPEAQTETAVPAVEAQDSVDHVTPLTSEQPKAAADTLAMPLDYRVPAIEESLVQIPQIADGPVKTETAAVPSENGSLNVKPAETTDSMTAPATSTAQADSVSLSDLNSLNDIPSVPTIIVVEPKAKTGSSQLAIESKPIENQKIQEAAKPLTEAAIAEIAPEATGAVVDTYTAGTTAANETVPAAKPSRDPNKTVASTAAADVKATEDTQETMVSQVTTANVDQQVKKAEPQTVPAAASATPAMSSSSKESLKPAVADTEEVADDSLVPDQKPTVKAAGESDGKPAYSQNGQSDKSESGKSEEGLGAELKSSEPQSSQPGVQSNQSMRTEFSTRLEASKTTEPQTKLSSEKTNEVISQVVDRVETIAATRHTGGVVVRLDPQDLGTITMTVKTIGDQVEAHIAASDDRVRTALDTTRSQLAQAIEAKGYSLKSMTVSETTSSQGQSDLANYQQNHSQQQSQQDQQSMRQQANLWNYAYSNKAEAPSSLGFRQVKQTGLDLWT